MRKLILINSEMLDVTCIAKKNPDELIVDCNIMISLHTEKSDKHLNFLTVVKYDSNQFIKVKFSFQNCKQCLIMGFL